MTSPFVRVNEDLAARVRSLRLSAQIALYAAAARALSASYVAWSQSVGIVSRAELLDCVIEVAVRFALGETSAVNPGLLDRIEESIPSEPSDTWPFTGAQDCWIAADTAVRGALRVDDPVNSTWYLLEPIFQETSNRMFGVTDPGSDIEEWAESRALEDLQLVRAISTLREAIENLKSKPLDRRHFDLLSVRLAVLVP